MLMVLALNFRLPGKVQETVESQVEVARSLGLSQEAP